MQQEKAEITYATESSSETGVAKFSCISQLEPPASMWLHAGRLLYIRRLLTIHPSNAILRYPHVEYEQQPTPGC
jgi:hypothetical protein